MKIMGKSVMTWQHGSQVDYEVEEDADVVRTTHCGDLKTHTEPLLSDNDIGDNGYIDDNGVPEDIAASSAT